MSIPFAISALALTVTLVFAEGQAQRSVASSEKASDEIAQADAELERRIRERFADSKISANDFKIRVLEGVAILEGRTDIVQHKGTATRLARAAGAVEVDNRIQISERGKKAASKTQRSRPRRVYVRRSEAR